MGLTHFVHDMTIVAEKEPVKGGEVKKVETKIVIEKEAVELEKADTASDKKDGWFKNKKK